MTDTDKGTAQVAILRSPNFDAAQAINLSTKRTKSITVNEAPAGLGAGHITLADDTELVEIACIISAASTSTYVMMRREDDAENPSASFVPLFPGKSTYAVVGEILSNGTVRNDRKLHFEISNGTAEVFVMEA